MSSKSFKLLLLALALLAPTLAHATWYVAASSSPSSGGTIAPSGTTTYADTVLSADYTVTPAAGYSVSAVRVNGTVVAKNAAGTYTVPKKAGTQYLVASFVTATYSVTSTVQGGGAIVPAFNSPPTSALLAGKDYSFNISPNTGYLVTDVKVDGVSQGPITSYTFRSISANHTLWASFALAPKVTAVALPATSQTTGLGSQYGVELDGSMSTTTLGSLSYSWAVTGTNPAGLSGVVTNPTAVKPYFYANQTGDYTITMTVSDGLGHSASASVLVTAVTRQVYQSQACTCCHAERNPPYVSGYLSSPHASTPITPVSCQSCHDPEFYSHYTIQHPYNSCVECHGSYTPQVLSEYGASAHAGKVTCIDCHTQHAVQQSFTGSFCQRCHVNTFAPNAIHNGLQSQLNDACKKCHTAHLFDSSAAREHFNGYTSYANAKYAAAYATARTACADCHKGATPGAGEDAALNHYRADWAASGHGSTVATPWKNSSRHDWKASGTAGSTAASNSATPDCVRCHSSAGFIQFLNSGRLDPMGTTSDHSSEPLTCSACHNADFSVRTLAARTAYYNYSSSTTGKLLVSRGYPDLKKSNVCLDCHSGRLSGATIAAIAASTAHKAYSSSFWHNTPYLDGHYLSAAGQLVGATGYHFPGQSYGNFSVDHSSVLVEAGSGPCAGCHMQQGSHGYAATAGAVCGSCHKNGSMSDAVLTERRGELAITLKALQVALTRKGLAPVLDAQGKPAYPYFTVTDWGGSADGPGNMGAAFNFSLLSHEPGAYVHNPGYAKRLLRDSLDWLVNGSVDRATDLAPAIASLLGEPSERALANSFLSGSGNASASCTVCHSADLEGAGTIVAAYNSSKHGKMSNGPSCATCHAPGAQVAHPPATMLTSGSQLSAKCQQCHQLHTWPSEGICVNCHNTHDMKKVALSFPHFATFTTAQYVTAKVDCNNCHTTLDENEQATFQIYTANVQWAKTGKGNPRSAAYTAKDFKLLGTPTPAAANMNGNDCVRCHTTSGYINYVSSGFSDIGAIEQLAEAPDHTREMIACSACHEPTPFRSYDYYDWETETIVPAYKRREVPQVKFFYNFSAAGVARIAYKGPDTASSAGVSNNCIVCHSGTMAGWTIKKLPQGFLGNTPFIDPHGMGAAGLLYQITGYLYNHAGRTYDPPSYATHRGIGASVEGPCVGCHMSTATPHLFSPVVKENGTITAIAAFEEVCWACHQNSGVVITPEVMNQRKQSMASSLKALSAALAAKGIYFDAAVSPYFFKVKDKAQHLPANQYTNWSALYTKSSTTAPADLMGAAFNLKLLWGDAGAYAHNDIYAKRLIYDSIDFLDDKKMDSTVYTTIQGLAVSEDFTADDKAKALQYVGTRR